MMEKRKRGRPPKPAGQRQDAVIRFRVRQADYEIMERAAESAGESSLSAWARPVLLRAATRRLRKK